MQDSNPRPARPTLAPELSPAVPRPSPHTLHASPRSRVKASSRVVMATNDVIPNGASSGAFQSMEEETRLEQNALWLFRVVGCNLFRAGG